MRPLRTYGAGALLAGVGLAYYVHRRSTESGLGYREILRQLPTEARHLWEGALRSGVLAIEEGLAAARRREIEIVRELDEVATRPASV